MLRLLVIATLVSIFCRWATGKWPWDYLRRSDAKSQAIARARQLLGVPSRAGRNEIIDAHRRLVAMVHPDKGGTNAQVHEANDARDLLLNELPEAGEPPRS